MKDLFFIMPSKDRTILQLIHSDTMMCLSTNSSLEGLMDSLKNIVIKFPTADSLTQGFSMLECGSGGLSQSVKDMRKDYYRTHPEDYVDVISYTVDSALSEVRGKRTNRPLLKRHVDSTVDSDPPKKTLKKTTVDCEDSPKGLVPKVKKLVKKTEDLSEGVTTNTVDSTVPKMIKTQKSDKVINRPQKLIRPKLIKI